MVYISNNCKTFTQWSYGIVLWEILTRGQKPYPGLDNAQVIKFIKKGKRMAAPPKCPSSVLVLQFVFFLFFEMYCYCM